MIKVESGKHCLHVLITALGRVTVGTRAAAASITDPGTRGASGSPGLLTVRVLFVGLEPSPEGVSSKWKTDSTVVRSPLT